MIIDSKGKSNCWESADGSGYLADHSSGDGLHCWIRDTVSGSGDSSGDGWGFGHGSGEGSDDGTGIAY